MLEVRFYSFGASIYRLKAFTMIFLFPDDKKTFLYSKGCYRKTLRPIAGRYQSNDYYQIEKKVKNLTRRGKWIIF